MIATDSQSLKSPSTSVGVRPVGFSARYSGLRCAPLVRSTISSSSGTPI